MESVISVLKTVFLKLSLELLKRVTLVLTDLNLKAKLYSDETWRKKTPVPCRRVSGSVLLLRRPNSA